MCPEKANFYLDAELSSPSPTKSNADVPANAVIKLVFKSDDKIEEDYFTSEYFSLEKITDKKKPTSESSDKSDGTTSKDKSATDQSSGTQSTTKPEYVTEPVKFLLKVGPVTEVPEETSEGSKLKTKTVLYLIPVPGKKTPLEPKASYVVKIGQIEDKAENILAATEINFTVKDKAFKFESEPNVLSSNLKGTTVDKNFEFVYEFSGPVKPSKFKKFSVIAKVSKVAAPAKDSEKKTTTDTPEQKAVDVEAAKVIDDLLNEFATDLLEKDADYATLTEKQKQERLATYKGLVAKEHAAEITQLKSELGAQTANTAVGKASTEDSSSYEALDSESAVDYSLIYLEDFEAQNKDSDSSSVHYTVCKYNKVVMIPVLNPNFEYKISLQTSKNGKMLKKAETFRVGDGESFKRTSSPIEIDFFNTASEDDEE
jgi:hypothetical protein